MRHPIFIAGGTGYIGYRLIPLLATRGHPVRALARAQSVRHLPPGCEPVMGNALDSATYHAAIPHAGTFVQLVGTPHPAPWKTAAFEAVDRVAGLTSVAAARDAGVAHFVYLSVAQPAPVLRSFIRIRAEVEQALRASGMRATIVRPWYVLGPGHWWPYALLPAYAIARGVPGWRETAARLGLVRLDQLLRALVAAIESPPEGVRVLDVAAIKGTA